MAMLKVGKRTHLFQVICFEIAFCLLISAVVAGILRDWHTQQPAVGKRAGASGTTTEETAVADTDEEPVVSGVDEAAVAETDEQVAAQEEELPAVVDEGAQEEEVVLFACKGKVTGMAEDGALMTDISSTFLMMRGIDQDDIVSISIGGREYILPVEIDEEFPDFWGRTELSCDPVSNQMMIVRNYQDFSMMEGYTDSVIGEEVRISLKELDAYQLKQRVKPEEVSLEEASNFRNVQMGSLGARVLYRGHSPIFPKYKDTRCKTSDYFAWENQVKCMINLNQDDEDVEEAVYRKCPESYYRYLYDRGGVSAIALDGEHALEAPFESGIAAHIRFMLVHNGPYMIHCRMGKDRAGFFSALLEALEGCTYEEIGEDYAKSFQNYYGIKAGSWMDRYNATDGANTFLAMMDRGDTGRFLEDDGTLTRQAARTYLAKIGLSEPEINALQAKLAEDIPEE